LPMGLSGVFTPALTWKNEITSGKYWIIMRQQRNNLKFKI
jgi:hypothetical protein